MSTIILACRCLDAFQDARYGRGRRVHNRDMKGNAHCTKCGATAYNVPDAPRPKKKGGSTGGTRVYVAIPPREGWPGGEPIKNGWSPKGGK